VGKPHTATFAPILIYPIPLFGIEGYLPDLIAANQVFIEEYELYEINPEGLEKRLMADRVSEFIASFQKKVKQMCIEPVSLIILTEESWILNQLSLVTL
jgi:hypothetical protein